MVHAVQFEQYPKGVQVDEFVSLVYASLCTTYEDSPHLWEDDKDIKSQLFRLFKKIDVDGNRVLTWEVLWMLGPMGLQDGHGMGQWGWVGSS